MKALTVWQPWASFIMAGVKSLETRPTRTNHRGLLVIHAAKLSYAELIETLGRDGFYGVDDLDDLCLEHLGTPLACLPRGAALGTVELANVGRIREVYGSSDRHVEWLDKSNGYTTGHVGRLEQGLGDYRLGRWAWHMIAPHPFPEPVPLSGKQGVWNVSAAEIDSGCHRGAAALEQRAGNLRIGTKLELAGILRGAS